MYGQLIARGTVNGFIKQKKSFTLEDVHREILKRGGILRVSSGVTISDYLQEFEERGILEYVDDKYFVVDLEELIP